MIYQQLMALGVIWLVVFFKVRDEKSRIPVFLAALTAALLCCAIYDWRLLREWGPVMLAAYWFMGALLGSGAYGLVSSLKRRRPLPLLLSLVLILLPFIPWIDQELGGILTKAMDDDLVAATSVRPEDNLVAVQVRCQRYSQWGRDYHGCYVRALNHFLSNRQSLADCAAGAAAARNLSGQNPELGYSAIHCLRSNGLASYADRKKFCDQYPGDISACRMAAQLFRDISRPEECSVLFPEGGKYGFYCVGFFFGRKNIGILQIEKGCRGEINGRPAGVPPEEFAHCIAGAAIAAKDTSYCKKIPDVTNQKACRYAVRLGFWPDAP
jgi:hypothetical protein